MPGADMLQKLRKPIVTGRTFFIALLILMVMNVFDAGASLIWIRNSMMVEGNPVMGSLIDSQTAFLMVKMLLVSLGSLFVWLQRDIPFARNMLMFPCVLYSFTCGGHLGIILMWLCGYVCVAV